MRADTSCCKGIWNRAGRFVVRVTHRFSGETMAKDSVDLSCRQCGSTNRIPVERALEDLSQPRCGACKATLLRVAGEALPGLDTDALAHPWDREALEKLQSIPYADKLILSLIHI